MISIAAKQKQHQERKAKRKDQCVCYIEALTSNSWGLLTLTVDDREPTSDQMMRS